MTLKISNARAAELRKRSGIDHRETADLLADREEILALIRDLVCAHNEGTDHADTIEEWCQDASELLFAAEGKP